MWNIKFNIFNKDSIYTVLSTKYDIEDYMYPVDVYKEGKFVYILGIHMLEGEEKEKKKFIRELKKNKKTKKIQVNENHIITLIKEEEHFYEVLFAAKLYHISPVHIKNGYETWNISSWERSDLEKVITEIGKWNKKLTEFELLKFHKTNFKEIYFPKLMLKLPEKQKLAFNLALKSGYYNSPRKSYLKDLARISSVSIATFQENLRKAESKLMPFFANNLE